MTVRWRLILSACCVALLPGLPMAAGALVSVSYNVPPPPLPRDPANLADLADAYRTAEFANNPGLYEMNAHWAYARGVTGAGESIGMTDTSLYAAHEEFEGRLHPETLYTVIDDSPRDPNLPRYAYFKVGERAPATAYPRAPSADSSDACRNGRPCKFDQYGHGTAMASTAAARRNRRHAHGMAFGARLLFWPLREFDSLEADVCREGCATYHGPWDRTASGQSWHDRVRLIGDLVPVVSNSWLSGDSRFHLYLPFGLGSDQGYFPFYSALGPRYAGWQADRTASERAILVWSAGNRPLTSGPLVDGAALPSITERQLRAATGGEVGLADLLLTPYERSRLSPAEAQRRAEEYVAQWKEQWLTAVAVNDSVELRYDGPEPGVARLTECAAGAPARTDRECAVDYIMGNSSRCGFASDWCVAVGQAYGSVGPLGDRPPNPTDDLWIQEYQTSPATATAAAALGLLLEAYRDADGALTVGTDTVVARLKATADATVFKVRNPQDRDGRHIVHHEEEQVRALIAIAGATDADLRQLIRTARSDFSGLLDGVPLMQEEIAASGGRENPFSQSDRSAIDRARNRLSERQWTRFQVLNRLTEYYTLFWRTIDPFPPQLDRVKRLLAESGPGAGTTNIGAERDLLARLIRQVEWIDEQLRRLGRTKQTVTAAEVRRITITSMIGHGLIDLKAATDPALYAAR